MTNMGIDKPSDSFKTEAWSGDCLISLSVSTTGRSSIKLASFLMIRRFPQVPGTEGLERAMFSNSKSSLSKLTSCRITPMLSEVLTRKGMTALMLGQHKCFLYKNLDNLRIPLGYSRESRPVETQSSWISHAWLKGSTIVDWSASSSRSREPTQWCCNRATCSSRGD